MIKPILLDETGKAIQETLETIKNNIQYVKGDKGNDGANYIITEEDYNEIAEIAKPKVEMEITPKLNEIESIAKGRATGYVFDTTEDMETWLQNQENVSKLVLGDNLYIKALNVPDFWWDGTQAQELETQKIDLTEYVKFTDYATNSKAGIVKGAPSYGSDIATDGKIIGITRTKTQYNTDLANMIMSKGTLENLKQEITYTDEDGNTGTFSVL